MRWNIQRYEGSSEKCPEKTGNFKTHLPDNKSILMIEGDSEILKVILASISINGSLPSSDITKDKKTKL